MWQVTTDQTVLVNVPHDLYSMFQELYDPTLIQNFKIADCPGTVYTNGTGISIEIDN